MEEQDNTLECDLDYADEFEEVIKVVLRDWAHEIDIEEGDSDLPVLKD